MTELYLLLRIRVQAMINSCKERGILKVIKGPSLLITYAILIKLILDQTGAINEIIKFDNKEESIYLFLIISTLLYCIQKKDTISENDIYYIFLKGGQKNLFIKYRFINKLFSYLKLNTPIVFICFIYGYTIPFSILIWLYSIVISTIVDQLFLIKITIAIQKHGLKFICILFSLLASISLVQVSLLLISKDFNINPIDIIYVVPFFGILQLVFRYYTIGYTLLLVSFCIIVSLVSTYVCIKYCTINYESLLNKHKNITTMKKESFSFSSNRFITMIQKDLICYYRQNNSLLIDGITTLVYPIAAWYFHIHISRLLLVLTYWFILSFKSTTFKLNLENTRMRRFPITSFKYVLLSITSTLLIFIMQAVIVLLIYTTLSNTLITSFPIYTMDILGQIMIIGTSMILTLSVLKTTNIITITVLYSILNGIFTVLTTFNTTILIFHSIILLIIKVCIFLITSKLSANSLYKS